MPLHTFAEFAVDTAHLGIWCCRKCSARHLVHLYFSVSAEEIRATLITIRLFKILPKILNRKRMETEFGGEGGEWWEIQGLPHMCNPFLHEHLRTFMWQVFISETVCYVRYKLRLTKELRSKHLAFTSQWQKTGYFQTRTENITSSRLRHKYKKNHISTFTRYGQNIRHSQRCRWNTWWSKHIQREKQRTVTAFRLYWVFTNIRTAQMWKTERTHKSCYTVRAFPTFFFGYFSCKAIILINWCHF